VAALREAVETFLSHDAARALTQKGEDAARRFDQELEAVRRGGGDLTEGERALHETYTEARFAFEMALESWPENAEAKRGAEAVARSMMERALETEDVGLAARLAAEVNAPDMHEKLADLRARIAARAEELSSLREQARLLDDRLVARPLGNVFIVAGITGGLATIPTRLILDRDPSSHLIVIVWSSFTLITGAYALYVLRGATKSLVSPRVGFTWAAVGAGCMTGGTLAIMGGEKPFHNAAYTTIMLGIGFVAHAMQTRRWLLGPAALMFVGALLMGPFPSRRVEIFGVIWLLSLTGVGVVLRRAGGATALNDVAQSQRRSR
jgi:hypothetical protein